MILPASHMELDPSKLALTAMELAFYPNNDIISGGNQMFITPTNRAPNIIYLVFYVLALLLAIWRFRWAPGLFPVVLHCAVQFAAFATRVYVVEHAGSSSVTLGTIRAIQALLAIAFLLLCYQMTILKAEHFHLPKFSMGAYYLNRYRQAVHMLSLILLAAVIVVIVYSALLGKENVRGAFHAFVILCFIFLGALILFMIFTPFWARETHATTGMFLFLLTLILLIPVIYLELRFLSSTAWVRNSLTAFYTLWVLPEAIVTIGMLMVPIGWWYPELQSAWIY